MAGKLTEAESAFTSLRRYLSTHGGCVDEFDADAMYEFISDWLNPLLAEREASLRAELAAAIEAKAVPFEWAADQVNRAGVEVSVHTAFLAAARIVRTTEGTGGETA